MRNRRIDVLDLDEAVGAISRFLLLGDILQTFVITSITNIGLTEILIKSFIVIRSLAQRRYLIEFPRKSVGGVHLHHIYRMLRIQDSRALFHELFLSVIQNTFLRLIFLL